MDVARERADADTAEYDPKLSCRVERLNDPRGICEMLCELRDEEEGWREAIEVAFKRKFAVVVAPEHYEKAEEIYDNLGKESRDESLLNPVKALKLRKPIRKGSLAEKLVVTHPVAEAIISHFFGDLICVEYRHQLRDFDAAITRKGFMSRGPFVEPPRLYDGNPFIGQRGLQQQLAWKERQRDELLAQEASLTPLADDAGAVQQEWSRRFVAPESLAEPLADARRLPALVAERDATITRLNTIDRAKSDELTKEQSDLENELRALGIEQRKLDQSESRASFRRLGKAVEGRRTTADERHEKFLRVQRETDVSVWLPRLRALRDDICTRLPAKDVASNECASLFNRADKAAARNGRSSSPRGAFQRSRGLAGAGTVR